MRRFLMIAPHFPPCRAVAAKRALCFARNLPELGWEPAVVALPEDVQRDPELDHLIPDVPQHRWYRGGPIAWFEDSVLSLWSDKDRTTTIAKPLTVPRAQGRWRWLKRLNPFAWTRGLPIDKFAKYQPTQAWGALRFLRAHRCEAIYATAGPFSTCLLAYTLSKVTGLPMVLDLRDPFTVDPIYTKRFSPLGMRIALSLERRYFSRASAVILNTRSSLEAYREAYQGVIEPERFSFIRNHFDPELFDPLPAQPSADGVFKIIFYGHLTPIRNSCLFLEALRALIDARGLTPDDIRFYTLGDQTLADQEQAQRLALEPFVETLPWRPFTRARSLLGACDLLLDLTSELHYLRISGKFYDYLASERPILSLSENPELRELFEELRVGEVVSNRVDEVAEALGRFYDQKRAGETFEPNREAVYEMSAKPAAAKLAQILEQVTAKRDRAEEA